MTVPIERYTDADRSAWARAMDWATQQHGAQIREWTGEPYTVHLERCAAMARRLQLHRDVVTALILHDVVEDTDATIADVIDGFGTRVGALVLYKTNVFTSQAYPDRPRPWRTRQEASRLATGGPEEQAMAMIDLTDNIMGAEGLELVRLNPQFAPTYLGEKQRVIAWCDRAFEPARTLARSAVVASWDFLATDHDTHMAALRRGPAGGDGEPR